MEVINNAARLITYSFKKEKYKLMPAGDPVEIPDEAKDESPYLKTLLANGTLAIVEGEAKAEAEKAIATLREEAEGLGIDVDKRWGETRLKEEIEKALAE